MHIGIIFVIFKIERNIPDGKERLNKDASWSDMSLFDNFKILVGILFRPSLLLRFKDEIILEASILSVRI